MLSVNLYQKEGRFDRKFIQNVHILSKFFAEILIPLGRISVSYNNRCAVWAVDRQAGIAAGAAKQDICCFLISL